MNEKSRNTNEFHYYGHFIRLWIELEGKSMSIADLTKILTDILLPAISYYRQQKPTNGFNARLFAILSTTQSLFQNTLLFSHLSTKDCDQALQHAFSQLPVHLIHLQQQQPISMDLMSLLLHLLSYILQHPISFIMTSSTFPVHCLSSSLIQLRASPTISLSPTDQSSESRYLVALLQVIRVCHSSSFSLSLNQSTDFQIVLEWITSYSRPMIVANEAMSCLRVILKVYNSANLSSSLLSFLQWSYNYLQSLCRDQQENIPNDQVMYVIEILRVGFQSK